MILLSLMVLLLSSLMALVSRRRCGGKVSVSVGTQTDEFAQHNVGQRNRTRHCRRDSLYIAPLAGECYHCSKECQGLRTAHEVKELRPCKLCMCACD